MIIYGTGEKKLTLSHQPAKCKCPECSQHEITFHFFRKYAHIFWIPAFPIGSRQVAYCEKCGASYEESIPSSLRLEMENARSRAASPPYLYSGSVLAVIVIATLIYLNDGTTTHYYDGNKKQANGKYVDGKQEGKWTFWHENGKIQSEQYYKDGLEDGVWTWYDENGTKTKEGGYLKGAYHGKWSFYYPSGALQEEDLFVENRRQGISTTYYENGQKYGEGNFERDHEQGPWTYWYDDGVKMSEGEFDEGLKKGTWKEYFPNGQIYSESLVKDSTTYIMSLWNENGEQLVKDGNGTSITYYDTKQKSAEGKIKGGLKDGLWSFWYPDGKLKEQGNFKDGTYTLLNSWDPEGKTLVTNGNGYHRNYYDNGVVALECLYREGKLHGLCYQRGLDGILLSEVNYVNGIADGKAKYYYETGELLNEGELKNNVQDGDWVWYHANGKPEAEAIFINGKKHGEELFYNESGDVVKREFYEMGKLIREEMVN